VRHGLDVGDFVLAWRLLTQQLNEAERALKTVEKAVEGARVTPEPHPRTIIMQ
jgi:hypothetical protein